MFSYEITYKYIIPDKFWEQEKSVVVRNVNGQKSAIKALKFYWRNEHPLANRLRIIHLARVV